MDEPKKGERDRREPVAIVALCASAGGLEAFQEFFEAMPVNSGLAFVVVQHQHHQQESILSQILRRYTHIPIHLIDEGLRLQRDCVYVLPSGYGITLWDGHFRLRQLGNHRSKGWPNTIDEWLVSLAQDQGERVVGVILSGAGTDGREGARAIKKNGGLVLAEDPTLALQKMMPRSVIDAGLADAVLSPREIPMYLLETLKLNVEALDRPDNLVENISEQDLTRLVRLLRRQTERNFQDYKSSTMRRQLARRLATLHIETVDRYIEYLETHPEEANHIVRYLLINVTSFFRDPEAFEALKEKALLPLLREMSVDRIFRVWVAGCATGEEAVSIAILIHECLRELDMADMEVRIFATDANRELIQQARGGLYRHDSAEHIPAERLREHFTREDKGYRVRNHISRMIVWSEHNLVEHPPFSQLHMVSCRNVLIYFQKQLQDRIVSLFEFALRTNGILFLGSAETMPFTPDVFTAIDSKQKIYRRVSGAANAWMRLDRPLFTKLPSFSEEPMTNSEPSRQGDSERKLQVVKDMLIDHYNATCIIVDEHYHVLYSYGEVDRYLRYIPGDNIARSVPEIAREGLDVDLTIALHEAFEADEESIERRSVWVRTNGSERVIDLTVKPIHDGQLGNRLKLVIFDLKLEGQSLREAESITQEDSDKTDAIILRLRQELRQTQEVLQSTTQALQAKSEELSASMEEIRSANEEVQTTHEELRTFKEELESMNEELNTLNTQLTHQNEELSRANDTLHNFLQSTEIGIIFLNQDLEVREFTTAVQGIFSLRDEDMGRKLSDIASRLEDEDLIADTIAVLNTLVKVEKEVRTDDGRWYDLRIRPYRTINNVIDGLVLAFSDITEKKQAQMAIEEQGVYTREVVDTFKQSLLELDSSLRVVAANRFFYDTFQVSPEETIGRLLYDLGNGQWNIPELRRLLTEIIPRETVVRDFEVKHNFPEIGERTVRLNARKVAKFERILLVITDLSSSD